MFLFTAPIQAVRFRTLSTFGERLNRLLVTTGLGTEFPVEASNETLIAAALEGAMRIGQLDSMTSARLMVIDVNATLQAAAVSLSNPGIGLAVVSTENGKATGVLTKSDLIRHLTYREPAEASVVTLMSRNIISCDPSDDLCAVWRVMVAQRLKNMPVLGPDSKPLGVLDIRDAMKVLFEQEQLQEHMLADYVAGVGYR
jgi:CBS domain-containing protein